MCVGGRAVSALNCLFWLLIKGDMKTTRLCRDWEQYLCDHFPLKGSLLETPLRRNVFWPVAAKFQDEFSQFLPIKTLPTCVVELIKCYLSCLL